MCAGVSRSAWVPWVLCEAVRAVLASQGWLSCLNQDSQGLTAVRDCCEPSTAVILFYVRSLLSQPWAGCGCGVSQDRGDSWVVEILSLSESQSRRQGGGDSDPWGFSQPWHRGRGLRSTHTTIALCFVPCQIPSITGQWWLWLTERTPQRSCSAGWAGLPEDRGGGRLALRPDG